MNIKKEAIIGDNLYVGYMIASGDSRMKKKGGGLCGTKEKVGAPT